MNFFPKKSLTLFIFLAWCLFCSADELTVDPPLIWETPCNICPPNRCTSSSLPLPDGCPIEDVTVDLINPLYTDGVLTTEEGGVLVGPGIRIQARKIVYTRILDATPPVLSVHCEGDLLIDYKGKTLSGTSLSYDFLAQCGTLCEGKTASPPWYLSGEEVELCPSGDVVLRNGVITTSEGGEEAVSISSSCIRLTPDKTLIAEEIRFQLLGKTLLKIPRLKLDLNTVYDSPFAVTFGWGGYPGTRIGLRYQFLKWNDLKGYARVDAFLGQGFGAGIETQYCPCDLPIEWYTRSYYANDLAIFDPERKSRYRFQGTFFDQFWDDSTTLNVIYDFVSDGEMAIQYNTDDFELKAADRTQFEMRTQDDLWIARLFANVKVNSFQSVNQELPHFAWTLHPFEIPDTGIVAENIFKVGYLDYSFSSEIPNSSSFHSGRFEVHPLFYRPFFFGPVTITPEAGFIGIAYSNNASGNSVGQAVGDFGVKAESAFSKGFHNFKHVVEPYAHYHYLTAPRSSINDHYIFTLADSYARLNLLRFGVRNSVFYRDECSFFRPLWIDLWANAFFNTPTIPVFIQKGYLTIEWQPLTRFYLTLDAAWNFEENQVDFYNFLAEWTITDHLAIAAEYRHSSRFDWRKADFYNFILESVRTTEELLGSDLSDRRDTILARLFYRINPDWHLRLQLRHGWNRFMNRDTQPYYTEYLIELGTVIFQHWRVNFTYEAREADNRYSFSLKLDPSPPRVCY